MYLVYFWDLGNGYTLASFCFLHVSVYEGEKRVSTWEGCCIGIVMGIEWKGRIKHMIWVFYHNLWETKRWVWAGWRSIWIDKGRGMPLLWSCSDICSLARAKGGRSLSAPAAAERGRERGKEGERMHQCHRGERETAFCITPLYPSFTFQTLASLWRAPSPFDMPITTCCSFILDHTHFLHIDVRELGARHTLKRFPSLRLTDDWSCCKDIRLWITSYNPIFWDLKEYTIWLRYFEESPALLCCVWSSGLKTVWEQLGLLWSEWQGLRFLCFFSCAGSCLPRSGAAVLLPGKVGYW